MDLVEVINEEVIWLEEFYKIKTDELYSGIDFAQINVFLGRRR